MDLNMDTYGCKGCMAGHMLADGRNRLDPFPNDPKFGCEVKLEQKAT
jgi:hypothetical protein